MINDCKYLGKFTPKNFFNYFLKKMSPSVLHASFSLCLEDGAFKIS